MSFSVQWHNIKEKQPFHNQLINYFVTHNGTLNIFGQLKEPYEIHEAKAAYVFYAEENNQLDVDYSESVTHEKEYSPYPYPDLVPGDTIEELDGVKLTLSVVIENSNALYEEIVYPTSGDLELFWCSVADFTTQSLAQSNYKHLPSYLVSDLLQEKLVCYTDLEKKFIDAATSSTFIGSLSYWKYTATFHYLGTSYTAYAYSDVELPINSSTVYRLKWHTFR